jgi:hypothetical protein
VNRTTLRITGAVLKTGNPKGTRPDGSTFDFRVASLIVNDEDFAEITLAQGVVTPSKGEVVDYVASVSAKGGTLYVTAEKPWPVAVESVRRAS